MICFFIVLPVLNAAQLSQNQLTSAFIYNFIKQINWPNEAKKQQFVIAVYQDNEQYLALKETNIEQKTVKNKSIQLIFTTSIADTAKADVVVIPHKINSELSAIASKLRQSHSLLVTSNSDNKRDTMINLVFNQSLNKMTFEVNKSNIIYEGLKVSNTLLLLGGSEIDVATLYRETEQAMLATKERESTLTLLLNEKQSELKSATGELAKLKQQAVSYQKDIKENQQALVKISGQVSDQQNAIDVKEQQLAQSSLQLQKADSELMLAQTQLTEALNNVEQQQGILKASEKQQQSMKALIAKNEKTLSEQEKLIEQNNAQLSQKNQIIDYQRVTIFVIVTISGLLIFIFIKYFQTNRKLSRTVDHLQSAQQQLVESEKMAALGSLVAGIAHEINTPVGIGVTAASLIKDKIQTISNNFEQGKVSKSMFVNFVNESTEASDLLLSNLEKAGDLIASFKRISVDNSLDELTTINVYQVIKDTVDSIKFAHKNKKIKLDFQCDENIELHSYPGILSQIINNLMINAILHAFEGSKKGNAIAITVSKEQDHYKVRFQDNGKGISKENLTSILEPFYTTKRQEGGSGLGLHIVYNLISEKLQSDLNYDSELNVGTWFEFKLYDLKNSELET